MHLYRMHANITRVLSPSTVTGIHVEIHHNTVISVKCIHKGTEAAHGHGAAISRPSHSTETTPPLSTNSMYAWTLGAQKMKR